MSTWNGGTAYLNDDDFVVAFESCTLPGDSFHHADHIRLAWIYLRRMSEEQAGARMAESIQRFAANIGKADKFHATMTRAWMRLVAAGLAGAPPDWSFAEFIAAHPHLLNKDLLGKHYSHDRLQSDEARCDWLEPDLIPLPRRDG